MPKRKKIDNSKEPPKEVVWYEDYGIMLPWCPSCHEPAYEEDKCVFCGQPFIWVDKPKGYEDTIIEVGEWVIIQINGSWGVYVEHNGIEVSHACCSRKLTDDELMEMLKPYLEKEKL